MKTSIICAGKAGGISFLCLLGLNLILPVSLRADVSLPPIFSDHAVLQKAARVPIWGKASPDENVEVALGAASAMSTAGADGKWRVTLDLSKAPPGPLVLTIKGKNQITVSDVLIGEVWLCSGQSNMEFTLKDLTTDNVEIAGSANQMLRKFTVENVDTGVVPDDSKGKWVIAGPETSGLFTAVGYYFGKVLQNELHSPVGLIQDARGASLCEAWIRREAFDAQLKPGAEKSLQFMESYTPRMNAYTTALVEWEGRNHRADVADPGIPSAEGWQPMTIPGSSADSGAIWLRRTVQIPGALAGMPLHMTFQNVQGVDQVYWNGTKIGGSSLEQSLKNPQRRISVPEELVHEGESTLMVRLFNSTGKPGITGKGSIAGPLSLDGEWQFQTASSFPEISISDLLPVPGTKPLSIHTPTYLFNGQIAPLIPYAIKGVIWYQGEANKHLGFQYRRTFPLMISDWRAQWQQGDFPFYFCQLANFTPKNAVPGDSSIAELREAQTRTLSLPHTGQAILIDIGEEADIHPRNKKDVGARLARLAMARDYGIAGVEDSGPVYECSNIEGSSMRVTFTHGPLVAKPLPATYQLKTTAPESVPLVLNRPDSQLQGFAICGEDKKWVWADARIDGMSVIVSSPEVSAPVAVRYAWANNPTCNLTNVEGLPAGPFRTDDFPLTSRNKKFGEE